MSEFSSSGVQGQQLALERAGQPGLGIVHGVGVESVAVITRLNPQQAGQEYGGNVLRRTCQVIAEKVCQAECIRLAALDYSQTDTLHDQNADRLCADANLARVYDQLGIDTRDVLMVGVTANEVGFGDKLDEYTAAGRVKTNPEGWRELPGFNAFFARPGEVPAIGSRLADCAHLEFEFKDAGGDTVIGFEHGTRTNMRGGDAYESAMDGRPVSYTEYVLSQAMRHYGADPQTLKVRLSSSIRAKNFVKHFDSRENMEEHIPGWYADGFVENDTNPAWGVGEPVVETDTWYADARGLILYDIRAALDSIGASPYQIDSSNMLDPADSGGEYSSYEHRQSRGDSRDLYLVAHHSAFKE